MVISTSQEARKLGKALPAWRGHVQAALEVRSLNLSDSENARWTRRLNRFDRPCGCIAGAAAAGASLCYLVFFTPHFMAGMTWLASGAAALAILLASSLAGKIVGYLISTAVLRHLLQSLTAILVTAESPAAHALGASKP